MVRSAQIRRGTPEGANACHRPTKARAKCLYYMRLPAAFGHELRRPVVDSLRDGIYELGPSHQGVPYRILYFFNGQDVVVLSHGITKGQKVRMRRSGVRSNR
ncbi:MAG: type II toxin-antitoxin system RelE/ParE family toxin [Bryobacteraceae bacterium]